MAAERRLYSFTASTGVRRAPNKFYNPCTTPIPVPTLFHTMLIRHLGMADYASTVAAMQQFTAARTPNAPDELWLCQHPPVFTQGISGKTEHLLPHANPDIPVVATNRGGQITYHGPGQVVAYPLIDLRRSGYLVKEYVRRLEQAVIDTLAQWHVQGQRVAGAPGIYVHLDTAPSPENATQPFHGLGKIAALGIKVSQHCTYHGLALNVRMDLQPYNQINPCGYAHLKTVDLTTMGVHIDWQEAANALARQLCVQLASTAAASAPFSAPHQQRQTTP